MGVLTASAVLVVIGLTWLVVLGRRPALRRFGAIPRERIVGRARVVIWSFETADASPAGVPPLSAQAKRRFRLNRIFKWID